MKLRKFVLLCMRVQCVCFNMKLLKLFFLLNNYCACCLSVSERLKEQQAIHEERLEKKIELLKSFKSKEKKGSCDKMEDEEDEWVSSMLLHAEKVKVEVSTPPAWSSESYRINSFL